MSTASDSQFHSHGHTPLRGHAAPTTAALAERPEMAARAVELLYLKGPLFELTEDDARQIVAYMRLVNIHPGTTLFREGDQQRTENMLLILHGDVQVQLNDPAVPDAVALSVLGAGSMIGELAALDGAPRSATCTALGEVVAAGMSRLGLQRLAEDHPRVALHFIASIAHRTADRLRALSEQLCLYARINADQAAQIERLKLKR